MDKLTLGQTLQNRINAERDNPTLKLMREARPGGPDKEAALQGVVDFFESAKAQITLAIEQGLEVPSVKLGNGSHADVYATLGVANWQSGYSVFEARHHYFPIAQTFLRWCTDNELKHTLKLQYNDADTWFLLSVEANVSSGVRRAA
ncbi:hypothetical protein [Burkholderia cenocepacia]|uniref:hypothetical protein n=1 Tax=Burkholderia cenocepacia TaxID=95486 RepID=UPI000760E757|nr:hypothetical protein [Burkholderia cenocepacia]KWU26282.1 hypothetical protein AS149_25155 [Burkholderia cenocepacia]